MKLSVIADDFTGASDIALTLAEGGMSVVQFVGVPTQETADCDAAMGDAVRGLAGKRSAVLLANHGPVVAGKDLDAAVFAMEELEETAKLTLICRGMSPKLLDNDQIQALVRQFDVDW